MEDCRHIIPYHIVSHYIIKYLVLELLLAEPRVRHILLHMIVVLVVLVVALRPRPERHQERGVAQVPYKPVDPWVVAERCVSAVVTFTSIWLSVQGWGYGVKGSASGIGLDREEY